LPELRTTWEKMTNVAIAGLARQELPVIEGDDAIAQLCAGIMATGEKPAQLLSIAGALQLYQTVGARPPHDSTPAPGPAAVETKSYCSFQVMRLLEIALTKYDFYEILPEITSQIQQNNLVVMPNMLPVILNAMVKSPERLETLLPIIGERGIWLARQNPAWQKILLSVSEEFCREKWDTGTPAERTAALQYLRGIDPAGARALLEEVMRAEAPDTLNAFIWALAINLSLDDEPLLESLLDDKRKSVRRMTASVLDRLPGSAYQQRMIERLNRFIKITPAQPATLIPPRLKQDVKIEVITPTEYDKTWSRDAIEFKKDCYDQSDCVRAMIMAAPLSYWENLGQCGPAELISCLDSESLNYVVLEAWYMAAHMQMNATWMEEIIRYGDKGTIDQSLSYYFQDFSSEEREKMIISLLKYSPGHPENYYTPVLWDQEELWSKELSEVVYEKQKALKDSDANLYYRMAYYMHPDYLEYVRKQYKKDYPDGHSFDYLIYGALDFREEMYRTFEEMK